MIHLGLASAYMNDLITRYQSQKSLMMMALSLKQRPKRTDQYCEVRSASYIDAYESLKAGINASIEFVMRREDFDECRILNGKKHEYPSIVEWEGAEYNLVRWRYLDGGKASVVCG